MGVISDLNGTMALTVYSTKKIILDKKIILSIVSLIFFTLVMGYAAYEGEYDINTMTFLMMNILLLFMMPIITMVYGSTLIRDEIDDKSITMILTSSLKRIWVYLGYYLSLIITMSFIMIIMISTGFLSFVGFTKVTSDAMSVYYGMVGLAIIGSVVYSSLFLFFSILIDKPIYLGLFYAFVWEVFVGSLPGKIKRVSINYYLKNIGSKWIDLGAFKNFGSVSVTYSLVLLTIVTFILLLVGIVLFREFELK
ncbi:MAG: hypothetical protein ACOC7O_01685 [Thermoplasmatota archaeon]